jgi:type VI secretion system protein ImpJ
MDRPVFWHEGLFLQPQHLQLEHQFFRSLLSPFHKFAAPHFWGVGEVQMAEAGLNNFLFDLNSCELILPDNTHVAYPGTALFEPRSFEDAWVDGGKPFTVYLGLRKLDRTGENVTVVSSLDNISDITTRYVTTTDPEEIRSLYEEGPPAQVKRLYYVLKVFWETEIDQADDYLTIPVAKLIRTGDSIGLSGAYAPPSLALNTTPSLMKLTKEIRDQIAARGRQLEAYKRERGIHTAEFGARDMVYLLALRTLNRYAPYLFHITDTPHVHPWAVYGLLRQVIGELSAFSEQVSAMGETADGAYHVPAYDHRHLWECYSAARSVIIRLLDEITAGPEYMIQLVYDGTYYAAELSPQMFEGKNRFYLVLDTEAEQTSLLKSLSTTGKLSAKESLPILIARALPGIQLTHLPDPPQELPRRSRATYLKIDLNSDQWQNVHKFNNIAMFWDTAPDDLKIELMVSGRD